MSEQSINHDPPEWHRRYLAEREKARAAGEDSFISLEVFEADLRKELGSMSADIYMNLGVAPIPPEPESCLGIAIQTIGKMPIHALRHPVEGDTNGWYIWCGGYSEEEDFFQPLCFEHLIDHIPQVQKYLSLPPGYRFLIDDSGNVDIWFDESLLKV